MKIGLKEFILITSIFFTSPHASHADILKMTTVDGLTSYMNAIDPSTLIIFDIDMVLLISHESYFRKPTLNKYHAIYNSMMQQLSKLEQDMALIYMSIDAPPVPLDDKIVAFVESLQHHNIPNFAFTAALTGSLNRIANIPAWRIFSLEVAGYHFEKSFPLLTQSVTFDNFPPYHGSYPFYNWGVLFANGGHHGPANTGNVLVHFLKHVYDVVHKGRSIPKRIIMISENTHILNEFAENLRGSFPQITFTGIHLTAADSVPVSAISESEFKNKMEEVIQQAQLNKTQHPVF